MLGDADWRRLAAADPVAIAERRGEDLAWIFYTSGTTGRPKGAMLSHRNLMTMAVLYLADVDALSPDDSHFHLAAQSHATGLFGLSHIAKATHQVLPASGGFSPGELADLLRRSTPARPSSCRRPASGGCCATPPSPSARIENIRTVLLGAAPVYAADLKAGHEALGARLWNGYGQGESPCTDHRHAEGAARGRDRRRATKRGWSVRRARAHRDRSRDRRREDRRLPPGEVGEVVVRGDTVMAGYWNLPEASAAALRGGWLHTGDLGALDAGGFLTLLDRAKDLIISGGSNIYPREIEDVLLEHPEVAEAAVIGVPDPEWGESVMALIVPRGGARSTRRVEALPPAHSPRASSAPSMLAALGRRPAEEQRRQGAEARTCASALPGPPAIASLSVHFCPKIC